MPLPKRKKTYGSKKNESGIIDQKEILLYTNDKNTLFDAYSLKNIKKFKRNNSYLAGPSDVPVLKKSTKKKVGRKLIKEILLQTVQNKNSDLVSTPKKVDLLQDEKEDPFAASKSLKTSVVLTPDLSLHVKRLSSDPFDKLCNSRLEQQNQNAYQNVDPRVNLSSDDESLTFNSKATTNVNARNNDLIADKYNSTRISDDKDEYEALIKSPVMSTKRRGKLRKRKVINKSTSPRQNSTSESSEDYYNHKLKVEVVPQKNKNKSLSLTLLLSNVQKKKKYRTRNRNRSNLLNSPHRAAQLLVSSTPIASSLVTRFRKSIADLSPVPISNDEKLIIQNCSVREETVSKIDTKASPPSLNKIKCDVTKETQYVLDKEYTTTPLAVLLPKSVNISLGNSRSESRLKTSNIGNENLMSTVDMRQEIFAAKTNSSNLVVSPNLFESFSRSVSISCDEHFQWKSIEEKRNSHYIDANIISVPPDSVKVLEEHLAIEVIDNCSNFYNKTLSSCHETHIDSANNPHNSSELKSTIVNVNKLQLQNDNTESLVVDHFTETTQNIEDTHSEDNSHLYQTPGKGSSQSKMIMTKLSNKTNFDMRHSQYISQFQDYSTKSRISNELTKDFQDKLSDYNSHIQISHVKKRRKLKYNKNDDNHINNKELGVHIDKLNSKRCNKSQKLNDDHKETSNSQFESDYSKSQNSNEIFNDFEDTLPGDNSNPIELAKSRFCQVKKLRKCKNNQNKDIIINNRVLCVHIDKLNELVNKKYSKFQKLNNDFKENYVLSDHSCYLKESELSKSFLDNNSLQSKTEENTADSYKSIETEDKLNDEHTNTSTISEQSSLSKCYTLLDNSCSIQLESLDTKYIEFKNEPKTSCKSIEEKFVCKELRVNVERFTESVLHKYIKCEDLNNHTEENICVSLKTSDTKCVNSSMCDNSLVQDNTPNSNWSTDIKDKDGTDINQTISIETGISFSPKVLISRLKTKDILKYLKPLDKKNIKSTKYPIIDFKSPTVKIIDKFITYRKKSGTPNDSNLSLPSFQEDCNITKTDENYQDHIVESINESNTSFLSDSSYSASTNDSIHNSSKVPSNMTDTENFCHTRRNSNTSGQQSSTDIDTSNDIINKTSKELRILVKSPLLTERLTRSKATLKKSSRNNLPMNQIKERCRLEDSAHNVLKEYDTCKPSPTAQNKPINNLPLNRRVSINLRTRRVVCQNTVNNVTMKRKRTNNLDKICESTVSENTNDISRLSLWEKNFDYAVDEEIKRISDMHLFKVPNMFKVPTQKNNVDQRNSCSSDSTSIVLLPGKKWKKSLSIVRRMTLMREESHINETCSERIQAPLRKKTFGESCTYPMNVQSPLKGRKYRESVATVIDLQSPTIGKKYRESVASVIDLRSPLKAGKERESMDNLMVAPVIDLQSPLQARKYSKSIGNVMDSIKCRESLANLTDTLSPLNGSVNRDSVAIIMNSQSSRKGKQSRSSVDTVMDIQSTANEEKDSATSILDLQSTRESTAIVVDRKAQGFLSETCNDTVINFSSLSISDDEASGVIEKSIDTSHCDRITTPRDVVLQRCNQTNAIPFDQCYTDVDLKNCRKIGEGVYGEVFLFRAQDGGVRVMKVIPVAGDIKVNGEPQKTFEEILSEIVIAMELSALRTPLFDDCKESCDAGADVERIDISSSIENATDTFNQVLGVHCVIGSYPSRLLDLWELYDETRGSENDSPAQLPEQQQYIVLELANAGQDLESYQFNNAEQALALFYQVAYALAVAEESCQFEHRDLHWGNVLIAPTDDKTVRFVLRGQEHCLASCGVRATIIDYSLSRLSLSLGEDAALYSDLARDPGLFDAVGDYQFDIYRLMRERNGNSWKDFEPYTNILWLHYTLDKMITALRYKRTTTKVHKHYIAKLKELKGQILHYDSCVDFVLDDGKH